ncbi:hypothetical protein SAMN04488573_103590 [Bacillus sp. 5mfcol3.1]|uniref:hypothetical protein n=1 Tax=Bacillus sp. 5mfcol3.1 TaxID=1761756 RepID=UPI0008E46DA0|nr:hypothetical protein [Bacillus sp. 5mfcol3.1]SFL70632.1 hypothetical protein SAMN04488573_103590 [Bacillus sp. 5mfcol3.1]
MSTVQQWLLTVVNTNSSLNQQLLKKVLEFLNQATTDIKIIRVIDDDICVIQADINEVNELQSTFGECLLIAPNEKVEMLDMLE